MNTLIHANEAHALSIDELSAVSGGHGQCSNNNGPSWGQIATAASSALYAAGSVATGGGGLIATYATEGAISMAKQTRD
jgi:hypothetical protein